MLQRVIMTLAVLVMLPSAASAGSFNYYGMHMGFGQGPDQMVIGGQLQCNGVAPRMAFVPGLDYTFNDASKDLAVNADFHYNLTYETAWQPYVGAGVAMNVWSQTTTDSRRDERNASTGVQPGGQLIVGAATRNGTGGRFFTELKLGLGDAPEFKMLAGWNLRPR